MALIHKGEFITRLLGEPLGTTFQLELRAFEFPASAFFLANRQRGTFWGISEQFSTAVRVEKDTSQAIEVINDIAYINPCPLFTQLYFPSFDPCD